MIDAQDIPLEDHSVDGVLCRFGFMLMPDPEAASPRLAASCGRRAARARRVEHRARNPWVTIAGRILVDAGLAPHPSPTRRTLRPRGRRRLHGLLEGGGFDVERIEEVRCS